MSRAMSEKERESLKQLAIAIWSFWNSKTRSEVESNADEFAKRFQEFTQALD